MKQKHVLETSNGQLATIALFPLVKQASFQHPSVRDIDDLWSMSKFTRQHHKTDMGNTALAEN